MTDVQKGILSLVLTFAAGVFSTKIEWNETVITVGLTVVGTLFVLKAAAHFLGKTST